MTCLYDGKFEAYYPALSDHDPRNKVKREGRIRPARSHNLIIVITQRKTSEDFVFTIRLLRISSLSLLPGLSLRYIIKELEPAAFYC